MPASRLIPVPEEVDTLQLATLPVEAATAFALLHDYVALSQGDWIGLNLANSTVGHYLIPLAKRASGRVLGESCAVCGTCSPPQPPPFDASVA